MRKIWKWVAIPLLCLGSYSGLLLSGQVRTRPNKFNYYKEMALSLMTGKLDIACPEGTGCHDMLSVNGKYYFYYGPVPTFAFIIPILIWERSTPDSFIAATVGTLNTVLFLLVLLRIRRKLQPTDLIRESEIWFYALLWGFGTVHFYMSMHGDIWHISQVMAQTFLLTAVWLIFGNRPISLPVSGLFFALACFTRYNLIFSFFFFAAVINARQGSRRSILRDLAYFLIPMFVGGILMLIYNYRRFDNALEMGLSFMKLETMSGFAQRASEVGKFSFQNIIPNFFHEILKPPDFVRTFPFINLNEHGFGVLWATPVYLLLFPNLWKLYKDYLSEVSPDNKAIVAFGCLASAAVTAAFLFLLSGHGFMQFSARYTLDFQLFLILPLLILATKLRRIAWILLICSIYVNTVGAILFMNFFRKGIS